MKRDQLRLEIIKAIHRPDLKPAILISRAREFESWILENEPETPETTSNVKPSNAKGTQTDKGDNSLLS